MFQVISKATNLITKEVIYEGVKKEYESYWEAARALKQTALQARESFRKNRTSYRIPENYNENIYIYVSCVHWGSIRTTLYLKKI